MDWEKTDDGYSAFISDIRTRAFKLPGTNEEVTLDTFKVHRDRENDVTHWTLVRNGVRYVIFND